MGTVFSTASAAVTGTAGGAALRAGLPAALSEQPVRRSAAASAQAEAAERTRPVVTWPSGCGPASRSRRTRSTPRSEEHTSELQSRLHLVCRLLLEKKKKKKNV